MICGVATNTYVPKIWSDIAASPIKQEGLAILVQYLMSGMTVCYRDFLGRADLLRVSIAIYNIVIAIKFLKAQKKQFKILHRFVKLSSELLRNGVILAF